MSKLFQISLIFTILGSTVFSCKPQQGKISQIEFQTNYKFGAQIENKILTDTLPWKYQISSSDYASKGDYKNALKHWDLAMKSGTSEFTPSQIDSINQLYKQVSATDYILREAAKSQIVIINEAHYSSLHRFYTKSLLKDLYNLGYKNLGLEALGNGKNVDSLLNNRKYPTQGSGYYVSDPQFGTMIREALEIGYTVFPYEQTSGANGKLREIEQAQNIANVIKLKPNEKFLIHCGFDHIMEGPHSSWEKAMAERLKEFTGIDPLTINQVDYNEKSISENNNPLLKAINPKIATILINRKTNKAQQYQRDDSYTDIAVLHPITRYISNRPNWLFTNENRQVKIDLAEIKIQFPVLVLAFNELEHINDAIPLDITEIQKPSDKCLLALPKGKYNIVITNGIKSVQFQKNVK